MYRWVEHTGELEMEIDAATEEEVLADALRAVCEVLGGAGEGEPAEREVRVEGSDRARLLAAWIGELAFLAESEGLVPQGVGRLELDGRALRADVRGRLGAPPHLIKAVTYHRLQFERSGPRWRARAVLDV